MSALSPLADTLELSQAQQLQSRGLILERLIDVVGWPASRVPPNERQMAGDVLVQLLRRTGPALRKRCADRILPLVDAPKPLLRFLARDEIAVSRTLLAEGLAFDDADLLTAIREGQAPHWAAMAGRRALSPIVSDALVRTGDAAVIEAVLRNPGAKLSGQGVDVVLLRARTTPAIAEALLPREELKPAQGLMLFWWVEHKARVHILRRFALDRGVLIEHLGDLFALAAQEGWADPESRKALQLIERRQRNRAAIARSPLGSLEEAIVQAERGLDPYLADEIGHMLGVRPMTFRQILADPGGEPLAIALKAAGLKRTHLGQLWRGLKRPQAEDPAATTPWGRTLLVFEALPTAKAQTVLRYWNWSFTSQAAPAAAAGLDPDDDELMLNPAMRNAALMFGVGR